MSVTGQFWVDERQFNELKLSISITMTVSEWRSFRKKIERSGYEAHRVDEVISLALSDLKSGTSKFLGSME